MAQRGVFVTMAMLAGLGLAGCSAPPADTAGNTAAPIPTAQSLVGATPATLAADFGQPQLLRVDGPAQVWLYHSTVCGLNIILYPDATGTPRVAEAVPDGDPARCMQSLQHTLTDAALEPPAPS